MKERDWADVAVGNGRLGEKRAKKVMAALETSKNVSLSEFLGSIGISGVGRSLCRDLCNYFDDFPNSELTIPDIFGLLSEQVAKCDGFGPIRAETFCQWLKEYRTEIEELASIMNFEGNQKCPVKIL